VAKAVAVVVGVVVVVVVVVIVVVIVVVAVVVESTSMKDRSIEPHALNSSHQSCSRL